MSEAQNEAAAAAPPADAAARPAARGPALPLLLGVGAAALVAGGALGLLLVAPRINAARSGAAAAPAAHAEDAKHGGGEDHGGGKDHGKGGDGHGGPPGYRMDNFIVNPAGSNGTRFLMTSVAIEVDNPKRAAALKDRDVQLRDAVISTIERQDLRALTQPGARDSLRAQLVRSLTPVVGEVPRVYLPQFVLQ